MSAFEILQANRAARAAELAVMLRRPRARRDSPSMGRAASPPRKHGLVSLSLRLLGALAVWPVKHVLMERHREQQLKRLMAGAPVLQPLPPLDVRDVTINLEILPGQFYLDMARHGFKPGVNRGLR